MASIPFDGLGTFLLFFIGVPALVLQSLTPELRRVVDKRSNLRVWVGLPIALAVAAIVWGLVTAFNVGPTADWMVLQPFGWNMPTQTIWVIVLAWLFGCAVFTAVFVPYRFGRPEVIVGNLRYAITRTWQKQGRIDEALLQDLIKLGEESAPGSDKQIVLDALYEVADDVCQHPTYRGDALETLILRLGGILAGDGEDSDARNFVTAAEILERISTGIGARPSGEMRWADLGYTIHMFTELSHRAIEQMHRSSDVEKILMKCVQCLLLAVTKYPDATTEVSEALFKIGAAAIKQDQPLAATDALDKLFDLLESNQPATGELVADTLGLAAHFWIGGDAACAYARDRILQCAGALALPLPEALQAAREHCMRTTQFETADDLATLMAEF